MSLLRLNQIHKSFADKGEDLHILKGVDISLDRGEIITITGESGSGKSTLLYIMGLLDIPDSGSIFYKDSPINYAKADLTRFRNENLGFVFQFHYLLEDFTLEENIAMPMFIKTGNMTKSKKAARDLMKETNILKRKDFYPNEISGGEQQRAAVARALINNPEIVLADEPTGNLDSKHSEDIVNLMLECNQKFGQSFVVVTHDVQIADKMGKHLRLKDGVI